MKAPSDYFGHVLHVLFFCSGVQQLRRLLVLCKWPCVCGLPTWAGLGLFPTRSRGSSQPEICALWCFTTQPRGSHHL